MRRTKRDLSEAQFREQLAKHGFKTAGFSLWFRDTTGLVSPDIHYGAIFQLKPWKMLRRATIAHLIKSRAKDAKKAEARS